MTVTVTVGRPTRGVIGERAIRPDGIPKVRGEFAFAGDLWAEGMLWGRAVRSPHPSARVRRIDVSGALAIRGVHAVITGADLGARNRYGLEHRDQPVFADDVVRYAGEPVAAVAADHPETARRACEAIVVDYEVFAPLVDPELALHAAPIHPDGNVFRRLVIERGDPAARGPVVVEGTYEVGVQDQAFMGPEAGLAIPLDDGGVSLVVSTQWLHNDRDQVAECLGLPAEKVHLSLGGVGGAFGAREDVSLHIHSCLLALRTGRPVKIVYSRTESFLGHVHRHPARIWMRHTAQPDGTLTSFEARILLDGGAYRSSTYHVTANAACFSAGPYRVPNASVEAIGARTNNPPCGAMRGFGAVQVCFAHEAQMDRLANACGLDPVELRLHNALAPGDELLTGQRIDGTLPVAEVIRTCAALPLPAPAIDAVYARPGASGRTTDAVDVRRGVGFAVGFKNLMYAEGYMDGSVARCRLEQGQATITCAAAEVGQGFVTLVQQIAAYGSRRARRARRTGRHVGRFGRIHLGQSPDDDVGRRRREGVCRGARPAPRPGRGRARHARRGARPARRRRDHRCRRGRQQHHRRERGRDRVHRGVPPPRHPSARREGPGRRARVARVRRAPRQWSTSTPISGSCGSSTSRPRRTSAAR